MREVGDLGTLVADSEGRVQVDMKDGLIKLSGPHNILGRGLVIHEGAGGARLACAVIGILEEETVITKTEPSVVAGVVLKQETGPSGQEWEISEKDENNIKEINPMHVLKLYSYSYSSMNKSSCF